MDPSLEDLKNHRRRSTLLRFTLLAMASYQFPVGIAYLACFFGMANYTYSDVSYSYAAFLICSLSSVLMIHTRKTVTPRFILFLLHYQVWACLLISAYLVYAMKDLRHLVPIGCMLILFFVFIQSSLRVSILVILFTVAAYLVPSYIGISMNGQPGLFGREVLFIIIFVPICLFFAYMARVIQEQQKKIKIANARLTSAHDELSATHERLEATHTELEIQNERMIESIRYAQVIQRSLLPGIDRIKTISPDSMFIWMPKDIVGGDIFYTYSEPETSIIVLADCTGHGVPGAFLTMIVYGEVRKIINDEGCRSPSEILKRLNINVKNFLYKNTETRADDGLDAGVCLIRPGKKQVIFAGARIPLFFVTEDTLTLIPGDKQSLGYRDSDTDFSFRDHVIDVTRCGAFYMKSDGFTDQTGGPKGLRYGTRRFKEMLLAHHTRPFGEQRKIFLKALTEYRGDHEQKDDITLIAFHIPGV